MESIQCNPALTITDAIRDTSREKLYHELGLESPRKIRWYKKLYNCKFFKKFKGLSPEYLFRILPSGCKLFNLIKNSWYK